jgi:hypothetical protein
MKYLFYTLLLGLSFKSYSQSTVASNIGNPSRFLGYSNNVTLNFLTDNINRMRLNGTSTNNYFGFNHDVSGHLGIGLNNYFATNTPLTMLHLEGPNPTPFTGGQFRAWMRTGMFARENSDAMYVGMKPEGFNRSDAVIEFSDDNNPGPGGPDNLRFIFVSTQLALPGLVNPLHGNSQNGYEIMRMNTTGPLNDAGFQAGHVGIGPLFTDAFQPQNRLHMNAESGLATFMQISNVAGGTLPGTGQTATDGLKLGLQNFVAPMGNRQYGYLQWQEHTPFIVQTAWSGAGGSAATGERMRITSRGALQNTEGFAYPASLNSPNVTRIAISYLGTIPLTQPRSLVHMGFNGPDSWRQWMDIGTYAASGESHTYLGVFDGTANGVLAWGGTGSGDMRYIFTQPNGTSGESGTLDGLEAMRMTPTTTDGVYTGIGGDPNANLYGSAATSTSPTATLEVNSWKPTTDPGGNSGLRFSNLNTSSPILTNPGPGVLAVDADGDVVYVQQTGDGLDCWDQDGDGIGDPNEDLNGDNQFNYLDCVSLPCWDINQNGIFDVATEDFDGSGDASPNDCRGPQGNVGATGSQGPIGSQGPTGPTGPAGTAGGAVCGSNYTIGRLTANTRLNLSNNNYFFNNETVPVNTTYNRVAVGYNCTNVLPAKFNVLQREATSISFNSTASHAQIQDIGTSLGMYFIGHRGLANGVQTVSRITNNGGYFTASSAAINYGVRGEAFKGSYTGPSLSYGGYFTALDNSDAIGVRTSAVNLTTNGLSYAIYAGASGGSITRAGYFDGIVEAASLTLFSDSMFKLNVNKLSGSLKLLQALNPVSYTMDASNYPQMNFDEHLQFGYIAQEVENVLPNLVYDSYHPSDLDSTGTPIDSAVTYKSLNYIGFIPINTHAIIELNQKVDKATLSDQTIKTNVQDLTGSLDKVLDMRGVSYDWNHTVHPELNLDSANHVGFIAQEIAQIDPRLTYLADDSLLHVEYDKVVPILAEAIQELNDSIGVRDSIITVLITENSTQQSTIDDLNNRLTQLENCLSGILPLLCQLSQSAIQANTPAAQEEVRKNLSVTLSNRNTIVLDQNVPNPFAEQTIINFSIPETVQKAQIHFYDGNGRFMNSVEVVERGLGSVTVFGSDLSTGVYTYTLVADGQVVATKKMMKQ